MTEETRIRELLNRRAEDTITPAEDVELAGYISMSSNRGAIERVLTEIWEAQAADLDEREYPIANVREITKRTLFERWPVMSVAASLLSVVVAGAALYYYITGSSANNQVSVQRRTETSAAQRALVLPDGSTVLLKAGSRLVYPETFNDSATRTVSLDGEGYFDIQHDASKPFIVTTGKVQTHVLGTAFVIRAYEEDPQITVTVSRGKVRVTNEQQVIGTLVQDQQITFNKELRIAAKQAIKGDSTFAWTRQEIFFDDITFEQASVQLSERFGIKVRFADDRTARCRFTATFIEGESFNKILDVICAFNHAAFTQTGPDEFLIEGPGC